MDETSIPFSAFQEVLDFLPRAHPLRTDLLLLASTGARPSELEHINDDDRNGQTLYWRCGKNQTGRWRRATIPEWILAEVNEMRHTHRTRAGRFTVHNCATLRRRFNKEVRPHLGPRWQEKQYLPFGNPVLRKNGQFLLEIKGFRKSYTSTFFWRHWQKLGDCMAAVLFAQTELRHSSYEVTAQHYLKELDTLEPERWDAFLRTDAPPLCAQTHLAEWLTL